MLKEILPSNSFARSVSILAGGTIMGQAIIVLTSPLLTRLYSPDDFGLLAVYSSLLGIIAVVASLRYQLAIPLPESDNEAAHLVILSLLIVLSMTLFCVIIVFFFREPIAQIFNAPEMAVYLWLLPPGALIIGTFQVFNYWAIRMKVFPGIARTKLSQSISMIAIQIGGYALGPLMLITGRLFGHAVGVISLGILTIRRKNKFFKIIEKNGISRAAFRYKRFPIFSTWSGIFNVAGRELPSLMLSALFNVSVAGSYLLAYRVLAMPMDLIGRAIANVFFSQAAEANRRGNLAPLVAGIHRKLAQISMPPTLILILVGPDLFTLVFGLGWRQAGEFSQWMAPWVYLVFVTSPLSTLFSVLEKQGHEVLFQSILLIARTGALLFGAYHTNVMLAVGLFASVSILCYFSLLLWIIRATGNTLTMLWGSTSRVFFQSIPLIVPLASIHLIESIPLPIALGLTGILVVARYGFILRKAW